MTTLPTPRPLRFKIPLPSDCGLQRHHSVSYNGSLFVTSTRPRACLPSLKSSRGSFTRSVSHPPPLPPSPIPIRQDVPVHSSPEPPICFCPSTSCQYPVSARDPVGCLSTLTSHSRQQWTGSLTHRDLPRPGSKDPQSHPTSVPNDIHRHYHTSAHSVGHTECHSPPLPEGAVRTCGRT